GNTDLEDRAAGVDHAADDRRRRGVDVAARQRRRLDQRRDVLRAAGVAGHVDQAGLDDEVARLGRRAVAAVDDVGLEDVVVAEDALLAAHRDQGAERAAAAEAVGQVAAPAARGPELDRRGLLGLVRRTSRAALEGAEGRGQPRADRDALDRG